MTRKIISVFSVLVLMFGLMACDPPETDGAPGDDGADDGAGEVSEDGPSGIDDGGITEIPDDPELVEEGKDVFAAQGCAGCHQMDRDGAGPALGGVTERRSPAWLARMIMHPDQMRDQDPEAQALSEDYMAPMPATNVDPEQVKALLAYLNSQ